MTPSAEADGDGTNTPAYQLVYAALGKLAAEHRAILAVAHGLFDQQALPYAEIAGQLHLSHAAVTARIHAARRQLATLLAPFVGDQGLSAE